MAEVNVTINTSIHLPDIADYACATGYVDSLASSHLTIDGIFNPGLAIDLPIGRRVYILTEERFAEMCHDAQADYDL